MPLTAEQLELRRSAITGTDVARILGVSPWGSAIDVCLEKWGEAKPWMGNDHTWAGDIFEPHLLERCSQEHNWVLEQPGFLRHPKHSWWGGTLDARVRQHPVIVDAKYTAHPLHKLPETWETQGQWYLGLSGSRACIFAVYVAGEGYQEIELERDDEYIEDLRLVCEDFWHRHVIAKVLPPLDGSKAASEYLRWRHPRNTSAELIAASPAAVDLAGRLRQARAQRREAERTEGTLEQEIQALIGDADGLELSPKERITWKCSKATASVDWKTLARVLYQRLSASGMRLHEYEDLIAQHTAQKPSPRRFCVPRAWDHEEA